MIIITGARGTGKSFIGRSIANSDEEKFVGFEVSSVDEARAAYAKANRDNKELVLVCNDCIVSPADLHSSVPAYLIHITKTR